MLALSLVGCCPLPHALGGMASHPISLSTLCTLALVCTLATVVWAFKHHTYGARHLAKSGAQSMRGTVGCIHLAPVGNARYFMNDISLWRCFFWSNIVRVCS